MNQSAVYSKVNPASRDKLFEMYRSLFDGRQQSLFLEKRKNPKSAILERQITLSQVGFVQVKNNKVIPYNTEFVFESKEQYDLYPQQQKLLLPWSKGGGSARISFCRYQQNMTDSVKKPTCVYFQDDKLAKEFACFKILCKIQQPMLDKVSLLPKYYNDEKISFFLHAIQAQANILRDSQGKRRTEMCTKPFLIHLDILKIRAATIKMLRVSERNKIYVEEEVQKKDREKKIARRGKLIGNIPLLRDLDRDTFTLFIDEWLIMSQLVQQQEEDFQKEEQRVAEIYEQEDEEEMYEEEAVIETPIASQIASSRQASIIHHIPIEIPVDTEPIHTPIEITKFTLYIDKIHQMASPKLQIQFIKSDSHQRQRYVHNLMDQNHHEQNQQQQNQNQQNQHEQNQNDQNQHQQNQNQLNKEEKLHQAHKNNIFYDSTPNLVSQQSTIQCEKCHELLIQEQYGVKGYSMRDKIQFNVFQDKINPITQEKSSQKILSGEFKFLQLFRNASAVRRFFVPLEMSSELTKHDDSIGWKDHPMLAIDVRSSDSHYKDFTEFLFQASEQAILGDSNIADNNYYEVLRYPLKQADYQLFKIKGANKTQLWQKRRYQELEMGIHSRGHSLSNSMWSRQEFDELILMLTDVNLDGISRSPSINSTASPIHDTTRQKFLRMEKCFQATMKKDICLKLLTICGRGIEHHDRPHLYIIMTQKVGEQMRTIFKISPQASPIMTSEAGLYDEIKESAHQQIDMMTIQSIQQDAEAYCHALNGVYDFPTKTNDLLKEKTNLMLDQVVQLLKTQVFINLQLGLIPYSSHLVKMAFRVVQLFTQEIHQTRLEQCQQILTFLWQIVGRQQKAFGYQYIPQKSLEIIFQALILALPPILREKLLSFNVEYVLVDHVVSCFCVFFHFEAWARIMDYVVSSCLCDTNTDPLVYLVAIAIQIILDNHLTLLSARTGIEFLGQLKIYGLVTLDIDQFIKDLIETANHLKLNMASLPFQMLYDTEVQGQMKEKNDQLDVLREFTKNRNLSLSSMQYFIFLQAQYDPYRRLPEFQHQPDEAGIDVPEEHENSVLRDMEELDKEFTDVHNVTGYDDLLAQQPMPKLISKPTQSMIYVLIHDLCINTNSLEDQEMIVKYGTTVQTYPLPRSQQPNSTTAIQLQSLAGVFEVSFQIFVTKKKFQQEAQCLKFFTIDVRKFRMDTIYKMSLELKDCPPLKDRHYIRSTAVLSIIVTSLDSVTKVALKEYRCLQQSLYEGNPAVKKIQALDPSFQRTLTQLNRQVTNFDNVQQYVFQLPQWKSSSVCNYEEFKRIMKIMFNVDPSQVSLQQMYRAHITTQGSPFYILDLLINLVLIMSGTYTLKSSILFDLVQLFQCSVSSPQQGLLPEQVQALIHQLYRVCNVPINIPYSSDGVILKATIQAQKADLDGETARLSTNQQQATPIVIDITSSLNQIVNFKHFKFLNKDLLLVDNDKSLFFIQQMLSNEQINQMRNLKAEQYVVCIKYWSDGRMNKTQYIVDRTFKLVNQWQDNQPSMRTVEYVLGENKRVMHLQGDKGRLITKREFLGIMKSLPGLEYCMSSLQSQVQQLERYLVPKLTVYVNFKQYAAVVLKVNPSVIMDEYERDNRRAKILFHESRKHLQLQGRQIKRDYADHCLISVTVEIPNIFLSSDKLMTLIETAMLHKIIYSVDPSVELFELETETMAKNFYIKEQMQYHVMQNTDQLSFVDIQLLSHSQDFAMNYQVSRGQEKEEAKITVDYPHLALMSYPDGMSTWKPCSLENYIPTSTKGIKNVGVVFECAPGGVIMMAQKDLFLGDRVNFNEIDTVTKPWKHENTKQL